MCAGVPMTLPKCRSIWLAIDPEQFIATAARMLDLFSTAIGTPAHLTAHCVARNVAFLRGMRTARALFERKAA